MIKRVLYVIGSLNVGGAERHLSQIAIQLKKRNWEPEIFVLSPGGPLTPLLLDAGVPVHGVDLPHWLARHLRNDRLRARVGLIFTSLVLVFTLWRRRPQVVHFFLPAAYIVGGLASMLTLVPWRIMSRRSLNTYQTAHPLFARIERKLHPRMKRVCGNSEAVVEQLRGEGIEAAKLRLIHNGIDTAVFDQPFDRHAARLALGVAQDTVVFVIVANLIPYKGHSDLIAAFAAIHAKMPAPWVLFCLGRDDGIGEDLKRQILSAGLQANVRFLGSRSDVPDFLRLADVGILCSHEEGFSNAVLEGMAAALPMVVTDVGGNAEAVLDGVTGLVVSPHDPAGLGEALLRVSKDPNRADMGRAGRRRVSERFSMSACVEGYESLYREAAGKQEVR